MNDLNSNTHTPVYSRTSPYIAKIKERLLLNTHCSEKKTYHISLHIDNKHLHFTPGDSIAILPKNDPSTIDHLLCLLGHSPEELVIHPKSNNNYNARDYFSAHVNLSRVNSSFIRHLSSLTRHPDTLLDLLLPENKSLLVHFLQKKDLIDILTEYPLIKPAPLQELLEHFSPLLPRFYSISSSKTAHPEEVHILVALSTHTHRNRLQYGVASHFLCNLAEENVTSIPLYIQPSQHFRLPPDPSVNVIMVGPGTGVAPYRAFLQERELSGSTGKNWLFFGGRHQAQDFFYKEYWHSLEQRGSLRLSTAFSRDQLEKEYVQHKLQQESSAIWDWLENGAYFYICGDASRMAKDVEASLLQIIQKEGVLSQEESKLYLKKLRLDKRYLTDVY